MSKKTPFDDSFQRKMNELPLPDENEAWQKMRGLLDEKKKRRAFLFFRYEKIGGVLLLLSLLSLWLMIAPERKESSVKKTNTQQDEVKANNVYQKNLQSQAIKEEVKGKEAVQQKDSLAFSSEEMKAKVDIDSIKTDVSAYINEMNITSGKQEFSRKKVVQSTLSVKELMDIKSNSKPSNFDVKRDDIHYAPNDTLLYHQPKINNQASSSEKLAGIEKEDILSLLPLKDSNYYTTTIKDSLHAAANTSSASKAMIKVKRHNAYFIDAGVGVKQQLPFSGQTINAYNYSGDKALLKDYIPSLYLTLKKDKQWFLQTEFNYAAPRLINDFIYWQHTNADYVHGNVTRTENHLKKTFYNQVPVSFNVYLHSSWSAGAGIMYSWLQGAVAGKEVVTDIVQPGSRIKEQQIIPIKGYTDSFFYHSQTSLILQAGYQKNRWFAGLRYLQDVQPFITYTLPNGTKKDKLNASLELMIQYRLFRSDKFRIAAAKHK